MRRLISVLFVFAVSVVAARSASAQDTRTVGVTMGYPGSVGLLWNVTDTVAVRPEFSFSLFSSDNDLALVAGNSSSDSTIYSVGLSALLYLAKWDMTRAYVVPRYTYSRTSIDIASPSGNTFEETRNGHSIGGSFGAQHALGERFGVYGELGLEYSRFNSDTLGADQRSHTFATQSGVGVIIYF